MTRILRAGDEVEVRSRDEILATLDANGCLDGLPFMPEMLAYCGQRLLVRKSAHKTCDTIQKGRLLRMHAVVHLEDTRCSGAAHGGCEAGCELFWKEAWLRPVKTSNGKRDAANGRLGAGATLDTLTAATQQDHPTEIRYRCQATELVRASKPLRPWDLRQYVRDVRSRNVSVFALLKSIAWLLFRWLTEHVPGYRVQVGVFNAIQRWRGGTRFRVLGGDRTRTPTEALDLAPGDVVEVKSVEEIQATLDKNQRNRGLYFDIEQTPYCGERATVRSRVRRIIEEPTGRMIDLPGDCLILDGGICTGRYHVYCPRAIYSYWREIWLRRPPSSPEASS
jgi:hypothetical protein